MLYESTLQVGPFTDIPAHSTVKQNILKNIFIDFYYEQTHLWLLCNLLQVFHQLAFKCSISSIPEDPELARVIAARLLTNFTFVLQRIFKWKFLIIFCYTEVIFPRYSESNRTHIFLEKAAESIQKISFQKYSEKYFRKTNIIAQNLSNISEQNVFDGICLTFSNLQGFVCFIYFQ